MTSQNVISLLIKSLINVKTKLLRITKLIKLIIFKYKKKELQQHEKMIKIK